MELADEYNYNRYSTRFNMTLYDPYVTVQQLQGGGDSLNFSVISSLILTSHLSF